MAKGQRLSSKLTLAKSLELIASDRLRGDTKKPTRWYFRANDEAVRILLKIVSKDANLGWELLRNCDNLTLYGSQIPLAYNEYCVGIEEAFVYFVRTLDRDMMKWLDQQGQKSSR